MTNKPTLQQEYMELMIENALQDSSVDWSMLLYMSASSLNKAQVEVCLKAGANANYIMPEIQNNVLLSCIQHGGEKYDLDAIIALVDAGADIHHKNSRNETPLFLALSQRNKFRLVAFLLSKGADPYILSNSGQDGVEIALTKGIEYRSTPTGLIHYAKCVEVLTKSPPTEFAQIEKYLNILNPVREETASKPIYDLLTARKEQLLFNQTLPKKETVNKPTHKL